MSSYHNYVATYSGKKRQEAMWIHHFVILQLFHVKFRKLEDITFLHDNHSLLVCNIEDHEVQESTDMYKCYRLYAHNFIRALLVTICAFLRIKDSARIDAHRSRIDSAILFCELLVPVCAQ